jgi:hypothetical protein
VIAGHQQLRYLTISVAPGATVSYFKKVKQLFETTLMKKLGFRKDSIKMKVRV